MSRSGGAQVNSDPPPANVTITRIPQEAATMVRWKKLFRCVGKALLAEGLQALVAEIPFGGFVFNVARGAWNDWHEADKDDALRGALNEAAAVPAGQSRAEAE